MAYEVTATRRRPQSFDNLVGQEFVAATLKNTIESGKIAHAYLFSGPRGCGKTSTARILAKSLNCAKGPTATPCGECEFCKEITAGSSLDVIEIDGASNTSVNDIRQIKDEVMFPPNACRYKIYIIDEVHMLSTSAFNALLKTIEEPPKHVVFIFATTELQKVPATIKSRCQQFNFRLVPIEKVKEQLAKAAEEVGIKAEDEALYWIARESTGSMRDSYTLFDQVAAFSDGEITYDKIRDKLGLVGVDRLNELFGLCVQGNTSSALLHLDEYLQNGVSIEQLITNCSDYLRSLLLIKSGITKEALLGQAADRFSKEVLDSWNPIQIERALDIFMQLFRDIRYSLSPRYEFELAVSRLCWLKKYVSPAEVKAAVDAVKPLLEKSAGQRVVQISQAQEKEMPAKNSYMPKFSALEENQEKKDSPSPFPDGGAEPPVKNSAPQFFAGIQAAPEYEDEENLDSAFAADDFESYGPAPEDEIPPDMEAFVAQLESKPQEKHTAPDASVEKKQDDVLPAEKDKTELSDMGSVRTAMIKDFSVSDGMTAGLLEKTSGWRLEGKAVYCSIEGGFQLSQLKSRVMQIERYLEKLYGEPYRFFAELEKTQGSTDERLPVEVEILRDIFKGHVV